MTSRFVAASSHIRSKSFILPRPAGYHAPEVYICLSSSRNNVHSRIAPRISGAEKGRRGEEGRGVNESTFRQTLFPQMQPVERFDILGRNVWMQLVERLFKEIARIGNVSGNRDGAMIMIIVKGKW